MNRKEKVEMGKESVTITSEATWQQLREGQRGPGGSCNPFGERSRLVAVKVSGPYAYQVVKAEKNQARYDCRYVLMRISAGETGVKLEYVHCSRQEAQAIFDFEEGGTEEW